MIEIPEYATVFADNQPAPDAPRREQISRDLGTRLEVEWLAGGRVAIKASSWVGTIDLTSHLSVRVIPKLAGNNLGVLTMLAVAEGLTPDHLPRFLRDLSADPDEDALQILCRLVVHATEVLFARGLVRDYRGHADDLPYLRGRLDVYRQATTHFAQLDRLACTFDEFDHSNIENHLLLAGVNAARRAATEMSVRRRAAALAERLSALAPTLPDTAGLLSHRIVYGRRTEQYRSAHTWCRALLRLAQVDAVSPANTQSATAFLINMNTLFERFVERLVSQAFETDGLLIESQQHNPSLITVDGVNSGRSVAPDLVVSDRFGAVAIDAKYKRYCGGNDVSPADTYQLLLYAQCYVGFTAIPTSYLIHPVESGDPVSTLMELTVPGESGSRRVRVRTIGIPIPAILDGLRIGDPSGFQETIEFLRRTIQLESPTRSGAALSTV